MLAQSIRRSGFTAAVLLMIAMLSRAARAEVSILLKKGTSGLGASAGVYGSGNVLGLAVGGGYSYRGWLEIWGVVSGSSSNPNTSMAMRGVGVGSTVELHPIKQSATMPVSFSASAGLATTVFSGPALDARGAQASSVASTLQVRSYRFFRLGPSIGVIPVAGVYWSHVDLHEELPFEVDDTGADSVGFAAGVHLIYIDKASRMYALVPQVTIDNHSTTYIVAGEIVLPIH